jgi:hypothetical protein
MSHTVDVFVDELDGLGLTVSHAHAEAVIAVQLRSISSTMGISELTARKYLAEDAVRELAREAAVSIADEQPGADTVALPRDTVVSMPLLGRTIAGLAEALRVHLANDSADVTANRIRAIAGELSAAGQILMDTPVPSAGAVLPRALVVRIARYLEIVVDILADGGQLPGLDEAGCAQLAAAFGDNAAELRAAAR